MQPPPSTWNIPNFLKLNFFRSSVYKKDAHIFLKEHPDVEKGYVMSSGLFEQQNAEKLLFMPVYTRFAWKPLYKTCL